MAGQGAANRGAKLALQTDADATARVEQGIASRGRIAGQVRGQTFGEQARIAAATDEINRANAVAANQFQSSNVQNLRDVRDYGAETQQTVSDINTQIANQQAIANAQAAQIDYENRLAKAGGQAGALSQSSAVSGQQSVQQANQGSGGNLTASVLGTVGTLASAFAPKIK